MNASKQFCSNLACSARGKTGEGNIRIHDRKRQRYRCTTCKQTISARRGTMLEGLRKPSGLIVVVVTLLAYGCPIQAIVHALDLDERTVASWRDRAGKHCEQVHQALVQRGQLDLEHVQADEIRVKGRKLITWMGLAMMVSTRLWVAGVVSRSRDKSLADRLLRQVRGCSEPLRALLVSVMMLNWPLRTFDDWRTSFPHPTSEAKHDARRADVRDRIWPCRTFVS